MEIVLALTRAVIVAGLAYAALVAATHWAVRRRYLNTFGAWPRLVRRVSDPALRPLERRVMAWGGNPQDAPLWLLGGAVVGGLILFSGVRWLLASFLRAQVALGSGPRGVAFFVVDLSFTIMIAALFIRVIGSWVGVSPYHPAMRPVARLTDWLLGPIRRVLPPFGILDFSPLVALLALWLLRALLLALLGL